MNAKDYTATSERTEKKFPGGMKLGSNTQVLLQYLTNDLTEVGKAMDHMKKHLVYGADCEMKAPKTEFKKRDLDLNQFKAELLHHAMGKVTESIEAYEAIINHVIEGKKLDVANVLEEVFDGHWYDAGLMRLLDYDFERGWDTNVAKLFERFPEAFNNDKAMNRDLQAERAILEFGHSE